MEEWRYSSTILDPGTKLRRVVSFTAWYPKDRRLGGTQKRLEAMDKRNLFFLYWDSNIGLSVRSPSLNRPSYLNFKNKNYAV
jgi:hypothetical protein